MQQINSRYRDHQTDVTTSSVSQQIVSAQDMQKHYRNHANGIQSHRIGANTTTNIKYSMQQNNEIDHNGYLISKRNSINGINSATLSQSSGTKAASFGGTMIQQRPNEFVSTFSHHDENVNIQNYHQNMIKRPSQISAQFQDHRPSDQNHQDIQNLDFIQKANSIQQNFANEERAQQLQNQYQNQQAVTRQLIQSKTHRAQLGQPIQNMPYSKNQRHSNLQNYGYQQRIERINGSREKENINNQYLDEKIVVANQAFNNSREPPVIMNQTVTSKRGSFIDKNNQIQNLQFGVQKASLTQNQTIINQNNTQQMITDHTQPFIINQRHSRDTNVLELQPERALSQPRADSCGPAPAAASQGRSGGGLHSSGGSIGSHSYKTASALSGPAGLFRSKTHGKIGGSSVQAKSSILARIICPCYNVNENHPRRAMIKALKGAKQPIIQNSDNSVNCSQCGQFYAVKDQAYTHVSASGRKQFASQAKIVKTIREKGVTFKLDEPLSEIFRRMREMSNALLKDLKPHPCYLLKRVKRIDNLSYIAECLQSDNQTIHHAVHLMDIYSSKMKKEYDTLLISLVCLLISTKYLQIKYPGADTLNEMVAKRYSADQIIEMEGRVLDTIDWQLMVFPVFDYVKLLISQGCLFENEETFKECASQQNPDNGEERQRVKPTVQLAEHFRKYAEFFADFCMYQECFITQDPYLLSCAIVAYTRKFMGVAIIWSQELELLTQCSFSVFRDLYSKIEQQYTANFADHARSQNYPEQLLTEPLVGSTANGPARKTGAQLQLSSGNKTQKTQGSSKKHGTSSNANNNNMMDLKTPDKVIFDFNSVVSGGKGYTQDKFSHEKFQINSNSIEKFRIKKPVVQKTMADISTSQTKVPASVIFSDNKKQSVNSHSFKKMIMKNQVNNNLSDDKKITAATNAAQQNQTAQEQIVQINSYLPHYQKRAQEIKRNAQMPENYSSQKSQISQLNGSGNNTMQHPQISMSIINNNVTSPSANINENEQEVPPFKPMIIKSNSQAIGGNYECKTTTKKSPKGIDLEKINTLKEAMNSVSITAKLPSSTTNQSSSTIKLKINQSFNNKASLQHKEGNKSYGAMGIGSTFGMGYGPIKINQKIKINQGSNQKKSSNKGDSTAKKSQKSKYTQDGSSSKKIQPSKSDYNAKMTEMNSMNQMNYQAALNATYQQRLAEQRAKNSQQQQVGLNQVRRSSQGHQPVSQSQQQALAQQRNTSCVSNNQPRPQAQDKQQRYISGKPKKNLGSYIYANDQQGKQPANYGCTGSSSNQNQSQGRSVLSIKNEAEVITRKNSFQNQQIGNRPGIGKVNTTRETQASKQGSKTVMEPALITQQPQNPKNMPNALLRRATGGTQGRQTSIGALSHYKSSGGYQPNPNFRGGQDAAESHSRERQPSVGVEMTGKPGTLPKTSSLEELSQNSHREAVHGVNPPAIMFSTGTMPKNKSFSNGTSSNTASSLNPTKATLVKMIQDKAINNVSQTSQQYMSEQPGIMAQQQNRHSTHLHPQIMTTSNTRQNTMRQFKEENPQPQSLSLERAQAMAGIQGQAQGPQMIDGKPIQKMIKSGSQVLGKTRPRLNITRKEMLKQLNDKGEKMSELVKAAQHATRCTSNEKTTSTKKANQSEVINNFTTSQFEIQQLFQSKHPNQNINHQRMGFQPGNRVSEFQTMAGVNNSYGGEKVGKSDNQKDNQFMEAYNNDENSNFINIQNMRSHSNMAQNQIKQYSQDMQQEQIPR